jgi:general stress protein 26
MNLYEEAIKILTERFGRDTPISLATVDDIHPSVRMVNGYYEDGFFYVVSHSLSNKMKHIKNNPEVAVCGEWFTAHGTGENMGYVCAENNTALITKLREIFAAWYNNGHVNENDPNTCILRIRLTDGILFNQGAVYKIDFINGKA